VTDIRHHFLAPVRCDGTRALPMMDAGRDLDARPVSNRAANPDQGTTLAYAVNDQAGAVRTTGPSSVMVGVPLGEIVAYCATAETGQALSA
jgi:hypothetical protein